MINKQIESRINLLNFYINKLTDNRLENRIFYEYIMIIVKQLQHIIEKEVLNFFLFDINSCKEDDTESIEKFKVFAERIEVLPFKEERDVINKQDLEDVVKKFAKDCEILSTNTKKYG